MLERPIPRVYRIQAWIWTAKFVCDPDNNADSDIRGLIHNNVLELFKFCFRKTEQHLVRPRTNNWSLGLTDHSKNHHYYVSLPQTFLQAMSPDLNFILGEGWRAIRYNGVTTFFPDPSPKQVFVCEQNYKITP